MVKNVKNGVFAVRPTEIRFGCSFGKLRKYISSRFLRNQQEMNRSMLLRIHSQYLLVVFTALPLPVERRVIFYRWLEFSSNWSISVKIPIYADQNRTLIR